MLRGLFKAIIGSNEDEDLLNELNESLEQQKSARKEAKAQKQKQNFEKAKKDIKTKIEKIKMKKLIVTEFKIDEVESNQEFTARGEKDFIFTHSPQLSSRELPQGDGPQAEDESD